jgi:hypothetical protein
VAWQKAKAQAAKKNTGVNGNRVTVLGTEYTFGQYGIQHEAWNEVAQDNIRDEAVGLAGDDHHSRAAGVAL